MKRMALAMVLLVLVAVGIWTVPADAMTAERLESACRDVDVITRPDDFPAEEFIETFGEAATCAGFVDGFLSAAAVAQFINPRGMPFCQPKDGISIDQARRVFLKFTATHPEDLHLEARTILAIALREVFPCAP